MLCTFSVYNSCYITFSSIGRPKHVRVMAGALEGDVFLGPDAEVKKIFFCLRHNLHVVCCGHVHATYIVYHTYLLLATCIQGYRGDKAITIL